jgi:hypothetical protein
MPASATVSEAEIWERVIHPTGPMSKETARHILKLTFTDEERAEMHDLAQRNQRDELSEAEEALLDHYCRVGTTLAILKLRAKRVLKSRSKSA